MKEKLIIKNFGPIKSVELELGRFNVLIGEQATGKSTVAKVLAVCRYFSYIIDSLGDSFEQGLFAWGLGEFIQDNTYIQYDCKHYSFEAKRAMHTAIGVDQTNNSTYEYDMPGFAIELNRKSEEFKALLAELDRIKPKQVNDYGVDIDWAIPTSFFQNDVAAVMDNPFYLPAERGLQSIFSLGKSSIQNISDSLFNQFANLDRIARLFKNETSIEPLNIVYKNIQGQGFVRKDTDNQFYRLSNAATGYQSTIPIILLTKYYTENRKKHKTFIVEESEQNLFPTAQYKLMQYLVNWTINYENSILITTHSPYTLTSLNNMMYAYLVGKDKQKADGIIPQKYWLNPADVTVYRLRTDGTCEDIMDKEINQIRVEEIDGISEVLTNDWHKLADVAYGSGK